MKLEVEVPTRVDLGGGTLDIYPITEVLSYGCTVNIGVNLKAKVTIEGSEQESEAKSLDQDMMQVLDPEYRAQSKLPLISEIFFRMWQKDWPSIRITTSCEAPSGAGLGGSSALGVALAKALNLWSWKQGWAQKLSETEIVSLVQSVETRVIHCPTGCQDYWGAMRGQINLIAFHNGVPAIETIPVVNGKYLADRLILCYSGKSRASGMNNWSIFKEVFDGDRALLEQLNRIGQLSQQMAQAIKKNDWPSALSLSGEEWQLRKKLWPKIETEETKSIDNLARSAGASFTRICGAGGGGVMAVIVEPSHYQKVWDRLQESPVGKTLESAISDEGVCAKFID